MGNEANGHARIIQIFVPFKNLALRPFLGAPLKTGCYPKKKGVAETTDPTVEKKDEVY